MRIESGVAKRAVIRKGMIVGLLLIFAAWFGYDGWVGYPRANMKDAKANFPVVPAEAVTQNSAVTAESAKVLADRLAKDRSRTLTLADLEQQWGKPAYDGPAQAGGEASAGRVAFFVGTYGWVKVTLAGDTVTEVQWYPAGHDYSAVVVQKLLAAVLAVIAMIPLGLLLASMSARYVLDDEGLSVPGKGLIRYDRMVGVDMKELQKQGIVRLQYKTQKDEEATLVLDEEVCDKFEEIVLNLCDKKGWQQELDEAVGEDNNDDDNGGVATK